MNLADAERLFHQALELPSAQERSAFLKGACGDNEALRRHVEALIEAHEKTAPFLPTEPGDRTVIETPSEGPGSVIGRYKLLQKIGEGGMGVVYMAEQTQPLVRKVAFKIIKLGMDTRQVVARFEAERQALALMDHPNIAKVLDAGATDTGRPYFVMELVRGIPITEYCDKNHLSARQRLELFIPVCQAIQHAHQKGIIHRDIKPSNILVTLVDGQPLPMVIDFGIAKALHQRLTEKTLYTNFAQMIGTPAYMSPEQAEMSKLDVDTRTDIYALGVLLYELLTGTTPFSAKELLEAGYAAMQRIIVEQEPPRPSTRLSTMQQAQRTSVAQNRRMEPSALTKLFQGDLDWIVMKCLEKERGRRYETASALAADLQRHLQSEPVAARPPTAGYRLQMAIRRNRVAFAAAGAVVLALVLGLGATSWQAVRATKAEREESRLRQLATKVAMEADALELKAREQRQRAEASEQDAHRLLYAANLQLMQQSWDQNNIGRLHQLLTETEASPYRGFEWYYWQRKVHGELMTLHGHRGDVHVVAYSPDGRRIVTGSLDGTARVWSADNGKELLTLQGHRGSVNSAVFSPDSRHVVTGGDDGTARTWDVLTGTVLLVLKANAGRVFSVAVSPDGQQIAAGGGDNNNLPLDPIVRLWDTKGILIRTLVGHRYAIRSVAFSPDSRRLVTSSYDETTRIWDTATGRELLNLNGASFGACFSPDGTKIARGGYGSDASAASRWDEITVHDAVTGIQLLGLKGHGDVIMGISISSDGSWLATASTDSTVKVWEMASGKELLTIKGHIGSATCVSFSPDGTRLVTCAAYGQGVADRTAKVWDLTSLRHIDGQNRLHATSSEYVSKDRQRVVALITDRAAKAGDNLSAAAETYRTTVRMWNAPVWDKATEFALPAGTPPYPSSSDGQHLVLGNASGSVSLWDVANGKLLWTIEGVRSNAIYSLEFSPDGQKVAFVASDFVIRLLDTATGKQSFSLRGHTEPSRPEFSPDGRLLVSASYDGTVRIWQVATGKERLVYREHQGMVQTAAFSPDGRKIVSGGFDLAAHVWDVTTGRQTLRLEGHSQPIRLARYTPDGQRIVTASDDRTFRVWDATNGRELLVVKRPDGGSGFNPVIFSSDGERVLALSATNTAGCFHLAELATAEQVAVWQRQEREAVEEAKKANARASALSLAMSGQWGEAVKEFRRAIEWNPEDDWNWLQLGPVLVIQEDLDAYSKHADAMLGRFAGTQNAPIAERTAKICLLKPGLTGPNLELAAVLAERAVTLGKDDPWLAYYQAAKGLAEYRQGHFSTAAEWAQTALRTSGVLSRDAQAYLVLGMAYHQLKQEGAARDALASGADIVNTKLPRIGDPDLGGDWHDVLIANILLREAEATTGQTLRRPRLDEGDAGDSPR